MYLTIPRLVDPDPALVKLTYYVVLELNDIVKMCYISSCDSLLLHHTSSSSSKPYLIVLFIAMSRFCQIPVLHSDKLQRIVSVRLFHFDSSL